MVLASQVSYSMEAGLKFGGPGPVFRQVQSDLTGAVGKTSSAEEQRVAEPLRLGPSQGAIEGEELGPRQKILSDENALEPGGVGGEVEEGGGTQARVPAHGG